MDDGVYVSSNKNIRKPSNPGLQTFPSCLTKLTVTLNSFTTRTLSLSGPPPAGITWVMTKWRPQPLRPLLKRCHPIYHLIPCMGIPFPSHLYLKLGPTIVSHQDQDVQGCNSVVWHFECLSRLKVREFEEREWSMSRLQKRKDQWSRPASSLCLYCGKPKDLVKILHEVSASWYLNNKMRKKSSKWIP